MGRYEPARTVQRASVAKPLAPVRTAKQQLKKGLIGLLGTAALSVSAAYTLYTPRMNLEPAQETHLAYAAIPQIAATTTAQGTAPIADGTYVQLDAMSNAAVAEIVGNLQKAGVTPLEERLDADRSRLLLHQNTDGLNEKLRSFIALYPESSLMILRKEQGRDRFEEYKRTYSREEFEALLERTADTHDIPPDILKAVAFKESSWNPYAIGDKGASFGAMQIFTKAHPQYDILQGMRNPEYNIEYGAQFLKDLYQETGSWKKAVERYNGTGPAARRYANRVMDIARKQEWAR